MVGLSELTEREIAVLKLVAEGKENHDIAETLGIAPVTVQNHLRSIFQKLDVSNRTAAAREWWTTQQTNHSIQ